MLGLANNNLLLVKTSLRHSIESAFCTLRDGYCDNLINKATYYLSWFIDVEFQAAFAAPKLFIEPYSYY